MAKTQGKVKSIPVNKLTNGMQVLTPYGIGVTTDTSLEDPVKVKIKTSPMTDFRLADLRVLVVEYLYDSGWTYAGGDPIYEAKQIPLKYSQWKSAVANGEVDSDELVQFETKSFSCSSCGNVGCHLCTDSDYAKIIPHRKLYKPEEVENLIRLAMQSKGHTPEYEVREFCKEHKI